MENILAYIDANDARYMSELREFLAIPSVSTNKENAGDVQRCSEWLAGHMRSIGLQNVEVMPTQGHPVVYGDWLGAPGKPTVLLYGHYDVQPPEPLELWTSPPFEATVRGNVTLAHGSPRDSVWEYIMNTLIARINLGAFQTAWCFVGHSHFQAIFQYHTEKDDMTIEVPQAGKAYEMSDRAILNPGSVGQPRDRDPRAAYALFCPETHIWEPRRVEYDIPAVQKRILDAGLPARHAERLAGGW